ncbi:MAG: hypothetical protein U5L96_12835 [Owenweeksia sp.]|nr:hypothetical protein [Owenweeksia sp.]
MVLAVDEEESTLENRFTPGLGWQLTEDQKLEFRIQHRYRGSIRPQALHLVTTHYPPLVVQR